MNTSPSPNADRELGAFAVLALAACCAVPMLLILGTTTVLGVSLGWTAAVAFGLFAALGCILVARRHGHTRGEGRHHD